VFLFKAMEYMVNNAADFKCIIRTTNKLSDATRKKGMIVNNRIYFAGHAFEILYISGFRVFTECK
jgi:hypothetical protein